VAISIVAVSSYSGLKGCIHNTIICQYLYLATQMTKRMVKITMALLQCATTFPLPNKLDECMIFLGEPE